MCKVILVNKDVSSLPYKSTLTCIRLVIVFRHAISEGVSCPLNWNMTNLVKMISMGPAT